MAHVGEKLAFGAGSGFRSLLGHPQILLGLLAIGDIDKALEKVFAPANATGTTVLTILRRSPEDVSSTRSE